MSKRIGMNPRSANYLLGTGDIFLHYGNDLYVIVCDFIVLTATLDIFLCKVLEYQMSVIAL